MSKYLIKNYPDFYELFTEKTFTWDRTGGDQLNKVIEIHYYIKMLVLMVLKLVILAVEKYSLASSMKKMIEEL